MNDVLLKFGALLKSERERRKIALEDLAEKLKISLANLEAIEKGDATFAPSQLYFTLFCKSYSEAVGIDYQRTIEAIREELGLPPDQNGKKTNGRTPVKPALEKPVAAKTEDEPKQVQATTRPKLVVVIPAAIMVIAIATVSYQWFSGRTSDAGSNPAASVTDSADQRRRQELALYDWKAPAFTSPGKIKLQLFAKGQSWATILADGDTVIFKNLLAGRTYEAEANYRFLISVGIPSEVRVMLDGKEVNLVDPLTRKISKIEVNQMNLAQFLNPIDQEASGAAN